MKEKFKAAMDEIKSSNGQLNKASFTHRNEALQKSFKAQISKNASGAFHFKLSAVHGYSADYLERTFNTYLRQFALGYPKLNDIIWTEYRADENLSVNQTYTIPEGTTFVGIGSSVHDCNGRNFESEVKGKFRQREYANCSPGTGTEYNLFQIVAL